MNFADLCWKILGITRPLKVLGSWDCFFLQTLTTPISFQCKECRYLWNPHSLQRSWFGCSNWSFHFDDSNWIKVCMDQWDSVPNCQFWDFQWAAVTARVIKNCNFINWECFLPMLFTRYLNMFEVSVLVHSVLSWVQSVEMHLAS